MEGAVTFSGVPGEEMAKIGVMQSSACNGRRSALAAVLVCCFAAAGCGIKTEVKVPVAPAKASAKNAALQDLLAMLQGDSDTITTLSSLSGKVTLTVAGAESGKAQVYRSAPAYILMRRPDRLLLNVQVPLTRQTAVELLSRGDRFELWSPRDVTVYTGRNSAKGFELDENGQSLAFSARPAHILQALMPEAISLADKDARIAMTEDEDAAARYYVLTLFRETGAPEQRTLRRLWIERSRMVLAREDRYSETGRMEGIVHYSEFGEFGGKMLPRTIVIERPLDGYSLNLHFNDWRVNPSLEDSAFSLNPPPDAKRVVLKEK
jgi:hypothetical protein